MGRPFPLITMLILAASVAGARDSRSASPALPDAHPRIETIPGGIVVEWDAPWPSFAREADGSIRVTIPGYASAGLPGQPQLPFASILIALPSGSRPTLHVLALEESKMPLPGPLTRAPRPAGVVRTADGAAIGGAYVAGADAPAVLTLDHLTPEHLAPERLTPEHLGVVEMDDIGVMRGVRLARLTFYPVRPIDNHAAVATFVRASIAYNDNSRDPYSADVLQPDDPIVAAIRAAVSNPDQVQPAAPGAAQGRDDAALDKRYAIRDYSPRSEAEWDTRYATSDTRYVVEVSSPGLTSITYEALLSIGFPVTDTDPVTLRLTRAGNEIAAEWDGDGDSAFEPGERLLFYAEPRFHRYSTTDAYFLSVEATPGLRMASRSAAPVGAPPGSAWVDVAVEHNALYTPECYCGSLPPGRNGDRWAWEKLARPDRSSRTYPIGLPAVDASRPATLTLWLIGYTDVITSPDHRVDVSLNGAPIGRLEWNGKQAISATLPITPGILLGSGDAMSLTLPGMPGVGVEGMWLDAVAVRHARGATPAGDSVIFTGEPATRTYTQEVAPVASGVRAYDITDSDRPVRLTGVFLAGNAVTFEDGEAGIARRYTLVSDAGILTPDRLRPAVALQVASLAGVDYVVVSPAEIAPALAGLIALRQSQELTVVVEPAQAVYDTYGEGRMDPGAIRAYLADAYAAGATYALLVGDGTFDPKRYRSSASPTFIPPYLAEVDPWMGETASDNRYVTLDGDDSLPDMLIGRLPVNTITETQIVVDKIVEYETRRFTGAWHGAALFVADDPDSAGNFHALSDYHASSIAGGPVRVQPMYYAPPATTITATREAILQGWNTGAGLVMYTGHASWHQWGGERLFHFDDVSSLVNGSRLPVVLQMTCLTGMFHHPIPTLDEELLRQSAGGAVAVWGATGLGVATGHTELAEGFLRSVYLEGQTDLGLAALSGKLRLAAENPFALDLLDTFNLLGDPATRLYATSHDVYLPFIRR